MADTLAPFPPRQPPPGRQEKHEFRVKQRVPAFRADDTVLEELWRIMRDKCAEAGEPRTSLTFSTTTHASGNGPREEHEHKYERIDDLRRSPDKPDRLREYTLYASTSFLHDDSRSISFNAYRDGASISAKAPDADLVPRRRQRHPDGAPSAYDLVRTDLPTHRTANVRLRRGADRTPADNRCHQGTAARRNDVDLDLGNPSCHHAPAALPRTVLLASRDRDQNARQQRRDTEPPLQAGRPRPRNTEAVNGRRTVTRRPH